MRRSWSPAGIALVSVAAATLLLLGAGSIPSRAAGPDRPFQAASQAKSPADGLARPAPASVKRAPAVQVVPVSVRPIGGTRPGRPGTSLLVRLKQSLWATSRPGAGKVVGVVPVGSKYYRTRTVAWVLQLSADGRYGRVPIPYTSRPKTGWIRLRGLRRSHTPYLLTADLSAHRLTVRKFGRVLFRAPIAIGAPWSPTPPGRYFVTDRVPFDPRGPLGAFAFGISGIQTRLPPGWHGGNQLAIHGTNNPGSIGRSVSAGCLRVARSALERLKRILILGTPVVIQP